MVAVCENTAKMSKDTVNVLVFIPLIPALPVLVTWYLPWERWLPEKVPMRFLGPYLLYCGFAAWYFEMPWWAVSLAAIFGVIASAAAVREALSKPGEGKEVPPVT